MRHSAALRAPSLNVLRAFVVAFINHKGAKGAKLGHEAFHALFEQLNVEVHQEAEAVAGELQIGQHLRLMNRRGRIDGFDLDDDGVPHEEVDAIARVEFDIALHDGQHDLSRHGAAAARQLIGETMLISRFEQPWPQRGMDTKPRVDHLSGDRLRLGGNGRETHLCPFVSFAPLW